MSGETYAQEVLRYGDTPYTRFSIAIAKRLGVSLDELFAATAETLDRNLKSLSEAQITQRMNVALGLPPGTFERAYKEALEVQHGAH